MIFLANLPEGAKPYQFEPFAREDLNGSIVDRFQKQVERYPNNLAVKQGDQSLTYRELNWAANLLANRVLEMSGGLEDPIGFLIEPGITQIVAILGIIKAGHPYVGLDPYFPRARLEFMLSDSGARILITNSANAQSALELTQPEITIINLDELSLDTPTKNPNLKLSPESIASLQYTSGSTGDPKGVILTHKLILHQSMMQTNRRFTNPNDRWILLYSASFGASVGPIFGSLLCGACLYPFEIKKIGLVELVKFISKEKISIFSSVPSTFRYFASMVPTDDVFPELRLIILGGDTALKKDVDLYKRISHPGCYFEITYAGTEFYGVSSLVISKDTPLNRGVVPVGFTDPDKEVLLLNEDGNEVPVGEVGEIVIRSRYISPGYWRRPDLTKAVFLDVPGDEGMVQYRTGDLGRMNLDGCLEHLGRKDMQIKIRGHRVELAEVVSALFEFSAIDDAFVVSRPDHIGENQLIAYVVLGEKTPSVINQIRKEMFERLPTYMVPTAYVMMDKLPKTASGKVDVLSLPEPDPSSLNIENPVVHPRNPIEKQLVEIWEDLLDFRPVGVTDDFFELGGHSLLALRLVATIEEKMGIELPFPALIQNRTIEEMGKLLMDQGALKSWSQLVALQPLGSEPPLFCVPPSAVTAMIFKDLARHLGEERPFYGLEYQGMDDGAEAHNSIPEMARYNLERIRSLQPEGPYFLSGMCFGGLVALEMAHQLVAEGEQVPFLGILDSTHAPYLSKPRSYHVFMITRFINKKILRHRFPIGMAPLKRAMKKFSPDDELGKRIYQVFSTHNEARVKYVTQPYPGPITLFNTAGSRGEFSKGQWRAVTRGKLEIVSIPGVHAGARVDLREGEESFIHEPSVQVLAQKLNECLRTAG